jgi:transcriptional regulator with XRE-family HTH domain
MLKPVHVRLARAALRWSLVDLEEKTGISKNTLVRFEAGGGVNYSTAGKIEEAFTKEGVTFVYEDDTRGPGILLPKEHSRRIDETPGTRAKGRPPRRSTKRN